MIEKVGDPTPPSGLRRTFARAPIGLYRVGLGWIFAGRFLMLTHIGRVTGKERYVVLEVVRHDGEGNAFYVASGWGMQSDWLQNILENPHVRVQIRRRSFPAFAEQLSVADAELEMLDYGRRHPAALKQLARLMGFQIASTEAAFRELGQYIPVIRIQEVATGKEG